MTAIIDRPTEVTTPEDDVSPTEVNAAALWRVLSAGALAAGKDTTLPMLMRVHVFTAGGQLFVETTDRFRLVRARMPWEADDLDLLLDIADVRRIIAYVKTPAAETGHRTVTVEVVDGKLSVTDRRGGAFAYHDEESSYPKTSLLLSSAIANDSCEPTVIRPEYISDFKPYGTLSVYPHGRTSGMIVSVSGDGHNDDRPDIVGLIMPMRWSQPEDERAPRFILDDFIPTSDA